jgi:hypothetical protein
LLAAALKACKDSEDSPVKGKNNIHQNSLNYLSRVRPWPLRLKLFIYGVLLRFFLRNQLLLVKHFYASNAQFEEKIEQFKFGAQFGRSANVEGREWCLNTIEVCRIEPLEQAYLVYKKTINVKLRIVEFGRLDVVNEITNLVPIVVIYLALIFSILCHCSPIFSKAIECLLCTLFFFLVCRFFNIGNFDAYKVGGKYFRSSGWSMKPIYLDPSHRK